MKGFSYLHCPVCGILGCCGLLAILVGLRGHEPLHFCARSHGISDRSAGSWREDHAGMNEATLYPEHKSRRETLPDPRQEIGKFGSYGSHDRGFRRHPDEELSCK